MTTTYVEPPFKDNPEEYRVHCGSGEGGRVMTTVWTQEADARLRDYLASHELVAGIGTEESACSVAAINLALTEKVTDAIPKCMSKVVGEWMIVVQDAMPSEMRNSPGWKRLLPMAAGMRGRRSG